MTELQHYILQASADLLEKGLRVCVESFISDDEYPRRTDIYDREMAPFEKRFCEISKELKILARNGFLEITEAPQITKVLCDSLYVTRVTPKGHKYLEMI